MAERATGASDSVLIADDSESVKDDSESIKKDVISPGRGAFPAP